MNASKTLASTKNKRRYGVWVSKNRVLNPNKSKRHCPIYRNPNFDNDETKLLIQLWGDPKVQRELITTHKKHLVIAQLSAKMEEYGYYRSAEEITTRIKNMKCFYNRLKKEMELNPNLDPSWRHYTAMDAIMMRPIFSVRPNEVPAPSLKYLMEQEEEKRLERRRKAVAEGIDISDSDDDITDVLAVPNTTSAERSDDECIIPDADIEFECDDITLAAIANGGATTADKCDKGTSKDMENNRISADDELLIKMEVHSDELEEPNDCSRKQSQTKVGIKNKSDDLDHLLTPKSEPIDVDDFTPSNKDTKTPEMPSVVSAPNLMEILSQPKSSQAIVTSHAIANISMAQSTCYTNTSVASSGSPMIISTSTPSKISVVSPTILMPQTNQITSTDTNHSSAPMRIGRNLQAILTSPGGMPTAMTGTNGMKFILVNTSDQRRPSAMGAQTVTMTTAAHNTTLGNLKTNQNLQVSQKVSQHTPTRSPRTTQNPLAKTNVSSPKKQPASSQVEKGETLRRKEFAGIKSTLMRLLKAREDGNELQSQRLAIERERLQHERIVAEKYVAIFEQNQKFQQQILQQQQQILQIQQQQQQRPTTMQQLFGTTANGTSTALQSANGQLMMPPKLLITTMVPTSAANASGAINTNLSSKVLTTSNYKTLTNNLNATGSADAGGVGVSVGAGDGVVAGDKPLLIPKEEPEN